MSNFHKRMKRQSLTRALDQSDCAEKPKQEIHGLGAEYSPWKFLDYVIVNGVMPKQGKR